MLSNVALLNAEPVVVNFQSEDYAQAVRGLAMAVAKLELIQTASREPV